VEELVIGSITIPENDLQERFDTPGGPGGQHANRSSTAVTLRFDVAASSLPEDVRERLTRRLGAVVETRASESRSQTRNREIARQRMADLIAGAMVDPKRRRKTRPTKASKERRLAAKRARSDLKRNRRTPPPSD
jgi:ribosome-associated protein